MAFAASNAVKRTLIVVGVALLVVVVWMARPRTDPHAPTPQELAARNATLARAHVLLARPFVAADVDFARDPNSDLLTTTPVVCRYIPTPTSGTTPKFDCRLQNGEKVKVKYGWTREIRAEVAATRLLDGLGFPADRVSRVAAVRCFGCVAAPFHVLMVAELLHLDGAFERHLNYQHAIDFPNVSVERKFGGHAIEAGDVKGWTFFELSTIDPAKGGASRDEIDALRLMAIFLHHWDNKGDNQRLVCLHGDCDRPLAMLQDVGSDFGPVKVNLDRWRARRIWTDEATCLVSMKDMPYRGSTFEDVHISEEGRRLIGSRLEQLTHEQIHTLFTTAAFDDVEGWTRAFEQKVRQIVNRAPCAAVH